MKKVILIMAALALLATQADASVQYGMGLDGNGVLSIAGAVRASYDSDSHAGNSTTALLDLTGWQDISLVYYNSWGSNYLSLYSVSDGATVPLANMRSQNAQGDWISGLRADYYNYSTNALVKTIYGEGPIEHGAVWHDPVTRDVLGIEYQGTGYQPASSLAWGGLYDGWGVFKETLSGQIFTGAAVPEPSSIIALLGGLTGLIGLRRRKA